MKQRWRTALFAIVLSAWTLVPAYGEETARVEQVQVNLPDVDIFFYVSEDAADNFKDMEASLNHRELALRQVAPAGEAGTGTHYYFLVDCSTSTREKQLQAVKKTLSTFLAATNPEDTVSLVTFGVQVEVVLDRERNPETQRAAVDALRADQEGTLFFDAIAKTVELADQKAVAGQRKLAFLFSDSIDVNLGGYTREEINRMLADSAIPFYGLGFDTGTKEGLDGLGAVARQSGGQIAIVSAEGLEDAFFHLHDMTRQAWVASFFADSNRIDTERQSLMLKIKEGQQTTEITHQLRLRHWKPDQIPPKAVSVKQIDEKNLEIVFSEAVANAADCSSYGITLDDNRPVPILSASYNQEEKKAWLTLTEELPEGTVTLEFKGITDVSMEKNPLSGALELAIYHRETEAVEEEQHTSSAPNTAAWYVLTIVTVAAIMGVAVSAMKRKNIKDKEREEIVGPHASSEEVVEYAALSSQTGLKVHFTEVPSLNLHLQVIFQNGESQMLVVPIRGSLFVGRSEICEICLDDRDLSRQHFVIEEQDGSFSIANLSETNGTRVNGIMLRNPRILQMGDVIEAGQERFTFLGGGEEP